MIKILRQTVRILAGFFFTLLTAGTIGLALKGDPAAGGSAIVVLLLGLFIYFLKPRKQGSSCDSDVNAQEKKLQQIMDDMRPSFKEGFVRKLKESETISSTLSQDQIDQIAEEKLRATAKRILERAQKNMKDAFAKRFDKQAVLKGA
jgi:hypothetical protein